MSRRRTPRAVGIRALPPRRMHRAVGGLIVVVSAGSLAAGAIVLLALQGPWRTAVRTGHGGTVVEVIALRAGIGDAYSYGSASRAVRQACELPDVVAAAVVDASGDPVVAAGDAAALGSTRSVRLDGNFALHTRRLRPLTPDRVLVVVLRDRDAERAVLDGGVSLAGGAAAMVLVLLPVAGHRLRRWMRGMRELHIGLRKLTLDVPAAPVPVTGRGEIAYLAVAFNEMAGRLRRSQLDLRAVNADLEGRVHARTEELALANAELAKRNDRLTEVTDSALRFTDDVAHEFRTPLAVIMSFASLTLDGFAGEVSGPQQRNLSLISQATGDLARLVDDFLDSSRLRARTLRVSRRGCTVREIIEGVWELLAARAHSAGVLLERHAPDDLPAVFGDPERAGRALMNLTVNAIKFTPAGGAVRISGSRADADTVVIEVADRGPGLSEADRDLLFARFRQTGTGQACTAKGFGLGLAIVRELVTTNLGAVHVRSNVGSGSTFGFTMPVCEAGSVLRALAARAAESSGGELVAAALCEVGADSDIERELGAVAPWLQPSDVVVPGLRAGLRVIAGRTVDPDAWWSALREAIANAAGVSCRLIGSWPPDRAAGAILERCVLDARPPAIGGYRACNG